MIEVAGVCYSRAGRAILDGVQWRVSAGQHWAIIGPNGSGKTTLLQIAVGYLWPNAGSVSVLGQHYGDVDLRQLRRRIGWVSAALEGMIHRDQPACQIVLSGAFGSTALFDRPTAAQLRRADLLLDEMGCGPLAGSAFGVLSMGERQKVLIARSLMARPELLILDEPCAGLDIPSRESVLRTVQALAARAAPAKGRAAGARDKRHHHRDLTLIMVTHHIEEIPPAISHVLALRGGRVLSAGPKADVLTPAVLSGTFALKMEVDFRHGRYWPRILAS
jgi:iron complex transport system ATP-binding protein